MWNGMMQGETVSTQKNIAKAQIGNKALNQRRIHPTQKPVKLYKWLLKNYAKEGDRILDTHGGSLSLAIACHEMGFSHVSCEIDLDYHNDSVKRFNEAMKQQTLFNYE